MANPDLEQNIVYKVVKQKNGAFFSAVIEDQTWQVEYAQGRETKPHYSHSPLFAYRTLEAARERKGWDKVIWIARAKGIREAFSDIPADYDTKMFRGFWRNRWWHLPRLIGFNHYPPEGTVFCSSITLLEKVA